MTILKNEEAERILETINKEIHEKIEEHKDILIEIVDIAEDGFIIFGVFGWYRHFPIIQKIIDNHIKEKSLSYSITFHTEQIDYRQE